MATRKRNKNEPTKGDLLHQAYRNRAAMRRVYNAAIAHHHGTVYLNYWTPFKMDEDVFIYQGR